jgi:hypothetical protein
MIRQTAVCVRDIFAALKHNDIRRFIHSAKPCRNACAAGHADDDDYFFTHKIILLVR